MKTFNFCQRLRVDLFLMLLSIALSILIYYTPGITVKHMDILGNIDGHSRKPTIFVLPAFALLIYIVFNLLERSPSLLVKSGAENGDNGPAAEACALFYWKLLKLLILFSIDIILASMYLPQAWIACVVVLGLFLAYNLLVLRKIFQRPK
jgi:hypothetical protein